MRFAFGFRLLAGCALTVSAMASWAATADHTTYVVRLPHADRATLSKVEALGGVLDHFDGSEARAYIHHTHWDAFRAAGIPYTLVEIQPRAKKQLTAYPSYDQIGTLLSDTAASYPDLIRVYSLGQSVQGRELWAVKVTDQPDVEEDEPEFAYISTMHGDETLGTIMCLNFLDTLLSGYGTDTAITAYVNDTEIWIVPLMNPDGYELGQRWNANDLDLNRSFPTYDGDFSGTIYTEGAPDTAGRQPEVAHVMNWTLGQSLVLVANFHGGSLVANYPYDQEPGIPSGQEAIAPDDAFLKELSSAYAQLNPPMYNSPYFPGGITNGSAWYSLSGGMQDWHYRFAGAVDVTLEISNIKTPDASSLGAYWDDNRNAMFAYMSYVQRGARGVITDRVTGEPLYAQITVGGNSQPVFTDPDVGDYHRMLLPGTYNLRVVSPGYIPYTVSGLEVGTGAAARADVGLSTGDLNRDGRVDAVDLQVEINAILDQSNLQEADVDGGGSVGATDVQHLVNRILRR